MISSIKHRWLTTLSATAVLAAWSSSTLHAQPPTPKGPLPEGFVSQPPVKTGLAPKMTSEEKTATERVFEVRFGAGDEILSGLYDFVAKNKITSGHITGIGGLAPGALLGWGDPEVGAFKRIEIKDKTEIVSLIGDISSPNGKPVRARPPGRRLRGWLDESRPPTRGAYRAGRRAHGGRDERRALSASARPRSR